MLAESGVDTTVLERGRPSKDKPCGDAFVSTAVEYLDIYGIDEDTLAGMGGVRFDRIDMYSEDDLMFRMEADDTAGWVVPRAAIDQELRDIVSRRASVLYGKSAIDVFAGPDGRPRVLVAGEGGGRDELECDAVVLAAGASSPTASRLAIDGEPTIAVAVSTYDRADRPDALVFRFSDHCRPGYRWVFPVSESTANVGVFMLGKAPGSQLRSLGDELLADGAADSTSVRWRGGVGPLWSGRGSAWHHPAGIVSCGDAAGLVDPLNGEGITAALASGDQAGFLVALYLQEGRSVARLEEYSRWVSTTFGERYRRTPLREAFAGLCGIVTPVAS